MRSIFDLIVIGSTPRARRVAEQTAKLKKSVLLQTARVRKDPHARIFDRAEEPVRLIQHHLLPRSADEFSQR